MRYSVATTLVIAGSIVLIGCTPPESTTKKDNTGILGKTTQQVSEYDPNAGGKISDSEIDQNKLAIPGIGAMAAYGPIVEQLSKMEVNRAITFFEIENGRYPRDHEEFMQRIIIENGFNLPVLPGGATYQYDVANHQLIVVEGDGKAVIPDK